MIRRSLMFLQLNIKPIHNKAYNCIQGIIVSVSKYYGYDCDLMFANSWGFAFNPTDHNYYTSISDRIEHGWRSSNLGLLEKYHGLQFNYKRLESIDEALTIISTEINLYKPVVLFIDSFCCPWNPAYQKYHITHYCLAIGVEKTKEMIICIDPYLSENIEKLPFVNLAEGYRECFTFSISDTRSDSDWKRLLLESVEYNLGKNRECSAFDSMRMFANELKSNFRKEKEIFGCNDIWSFPLVRKMAEIGNGRSNFSSTLEYIGKKYGLKDFICYKDQMNLIWKKWKHINTWLLKAFMSDDSSYPIGVVSSLILEIADTEEKYAMELYYLMQKKMDTNTFLKDIYHEERLNSNSSKCSYASDLLSTEIVYQELFNCVLKNPINNSIIFNQTEQSYQDLNARSNRVARLLIKKGVKPNKIVGIMVKRSLEMVIGLLAIIKAGGAYLPIDPSYPSSRINYMLDDSKVDIVLTQGDLTNKIEFRGQFIDLNCSSDYDNDNSNILSINTSNDLVYVIYTSGSTGIPKGVMIEHKSVCNFIKGITEKIDFSSCNTILALTTISFDIFVLETLLALSQGLKIVIANEEQQRNPKLLSELIINNNVDIMQITPSRLKLLIGSSKNLVCFKKLKVIMVGGEPLSQKLLDELKRISNARIYNMYGPTETTIWSTVKDQTDCNEVNIGKPILNTNIYIVDCENKKVNVGQEGELCIAGYGLARGYINKPELTSEKFVQNPFEPGERMYKTGDIARWLPNGDIECLGRVDNQVKIRGFRIELEEIEKQLTNVDGIHDSVVIAKENSYGDKYLVAYYISVKEFSVSEINTYLGNNLPEYMIPSVYVRLDSLPMTLNGKVDRRALPEPMEERPNFQIEYLVPSNEVERIIIQIWKSVLKKNVTSVNDSFFEIGGDSLLVVLMYEEIERYYPNKIGIGDIFAYPTISKLSKYIIEKISKDSNVINTLTLPMDFFYIDNNNRLLLKIDVRDDLLIALKNISIFLMIEIEDILVSLFIYLLSNITEANEICTYSMLNNPNIIELVKADISNVSDLYELIPSINQIIKKVGRIQVPRIDVFKEKKGRPINSIIPMICLQEYLCNDITDIMDIVLVLGKEQDCINITLEYNNLKLNGKKMKDMIINYAKLLKLVSIELKKSL